VKAGPVSATADVSTSTLSDAGSAAESVTPPVAVATVDTASEAATSSVDAVGAVTGAPVVSSPTSTPVGLGGDSSTSSAKLLRTPLATVSAGLAVGSSGVSAVAAATAPAVIVRVKVGAGNGLVHGSLKVSQASAEANGGADAGARGSDAGTALPSSTPRLLVGGHVPASGFAERPQDFAPGVATTRGPVLRAASSFALPALSAGALDPPGLVRLPSAAPGAVSGASPATNRTAPARPRPLPAPPESRGPFGLGGGASPGVGFAAILFAALSALLLVVPHTGRRLRPFVGLARPPAFAFLLERPG
jgi:hypothetical protein